MTLSTVPLEAVIPTRRHRGKVWGSPKKQYLVFFGIVASASPQSTWGTSSSRTAASSLREGDLTLPMAAGQGAAMRQFCAAGRAPSGHTSCQLQRLDAGCLWHGVMGEGESCATQGAGVLAAARAGSSQRWLRLAASPFPCRGVFPWLCGRSGAQPSAGHPHPGTGSGRQLVLAEEARAGEQDGSREQHSPGLRQHHFSRCKEQPWPSG